MPIIESAITINRDAPNIYGLLKNMEIFPLLIAGVEQVKVRRLSENQVVSEWSINVEGTKISWREKDSFDDDSMTVKFKILEGDFVSYSGEWRVLENGACSRLSFVLSFDWEIRHLREELIPELERKARLVIRLMLRGIKRNIGMERAMSQGVTPVDAATKVVSELLTYRNRHEQRIIGFFDHLKETTGSEPFVVIPPGYGETKRDALSTAYYLAKNGFNVIRYDATNHVGESDGEIVNTTLSQAKDDLIATLNYLESNFSTSRIGVVASSLAKRIAIKAASEDKRIVLLIGVVGVVNLRETLRAVYNEDMIGTYFEGKKWGVTDVLGFEVSGRFLETAITDGYYDLKSTLEDFKKLDIPVVFLVAENDAWVKLGDVRLVLEASPMIRSELYILPEALHQLQENPQTARVALRQIVVSCSNYLCNRLMKLDNVIEPGLRELALQDKIEKKRLQSLRKISKQEEQTFWSEYLSKYYILIRSPDYKAYLQDISELLGEIEENDVVLDAGCGNGHFGAWILSRLANNEAPQIGKIETLPQFVYIGLDFAEGALREADSRCTELLRQLPLPRQGFNPYYFLLTDLETALPLADNTVSKICCSLVVSYLKDPMLVLRELMRVLEPSGKIVVTSLKPHSDLSVVYRNFVDVAITETEIIEGRRLLSSTGKIRQKESEGCYQFFTKQELTAMIMAAGGKNIQSRLSFGSQANIVVAQKGTVLGNRLR